MHITPAKSLHHCFWHWSQALNLGSSFRPGGCRISTPTPSMHSESSIVMAISSESSMVRRAAYMSTPWSGLSPSWEFYGQEWLVYASSVVRIVSCMSVPWSRLPPLWALYGQGPVYESSMVRDLVYESSMVRTTTSMRALRSVRALWSGILSMRALWSGMPCQWELYGQASLHSRAVPGCPGLNCGVCAGGYASQLNFTLLGTPHYLLKRRA